MRFTFPPYTFWNAKSQNLKPKTQNLNYGQTLNRVASPRTRLTVPFSVKKA
jgi:hypothetical protein